VAVVATPQLVHRLPVTPLALLAAGGLLYTTGAVVYALKRPNISPRWFGFHELFHAFVIGAALAHFVAMAGWVVPHA
jgi:hemolysin III